MEKRSIWFDIFLFITFIVMSFSFVMFKEPIDYDELWNYNFASSISKGMVPYKDFSMIVTPLKAIINGIALSIFGNELVVTRMVTVLISGVFLFLVYKIFENLKIKKILCVIYSLLFGLLYSVVITSEYNFFSVILLLIIVLLEIKKKPKDKLRKFISGIILGLCILTKQTIGVFYTVAYIIYILISDKVIDKKKSKDVILNIVFTILGLLIPVTIFIIYLICTNSFNDFVSYCITGIKEFSNAISYINLILEKNVAIMFLSIVIPIVWILILINIIKTKNKELLLLLICSIASFVIIIPIANIGHFLIAIIPSLICILYYISLKINYKGFKYDNLVINILLVTFFLSSCIYTVTLYINLKDNYTDIPHYSMVPISDELKSNIDKIDSYIIQSDKDVYILDASAPIYMIPLNRYTKDLDMLLKGNLGEKGSSGVIEKIDSLDNSRFMIRKDEDELNWQTPLDVIHYVKDNYEYVEEVGKFLVYEQKQ